MLTLFWHSEAMTNSVRISHLGASYFFTARLSDQNSDLLVQKITHLRAAMRGMLSRYVTRIDAIVVLPSVVHMIMTLPEHDTDVEGRWDMLQSLFARDAIPAAATDGAALHAKHANLWQSRVRIQRLQSDEDFAAHRDLILMAPVHYGLAQDPKNWPHSSIHRDIAAGLQVPTAPSAYSEYITKITQPVEQGADRDFLAMGFGPGRLGAMDDAPLVAASG